MLSHDEPAVVLDLSATGIGIIRSLKQKGVRVNAYDVKGKYEIGKTRYAACGVCPSPVTEEEQLLRFLSRLGESFDKKAALFAGSDDFVHFISKYREKLSSTYSFLLPEHSLIEAVLDKRRTYDLAIEHGVPCPRTYTIRNVEHLEEMIDEILFPCILKPVYSSDFRKRLPHTLYKKAIVVEQASQLRQEYVFYRQFGELMVQELIIGGEDRIYSVKTLFDDQMNLLGLWMNQKIHQFPPYFGSTALAVSIRDEQVIEAAVPFVKALRLKGLAIAEFKKDPRDGKLKFIEINPRIGLTQRLSAACGVDLAYLYYLYVTGRKPESITEQREGVKWIYFVRDYISFRQKQEQGTMTFGDWLRSISGKKVEALFAWDDPMPFFRSLFSHLRNVRHSNERPER